jgi:probable selenium-dependent hydroxylase accessory protein YqeC
MESLSGWFEKNIFSGGISPDSRQGLPAGIHPGATPGIPPDAAPVLTVIGSGGKTSLIWLLARSRRRRRVLVSPATKMLIPPPEADCYDRLVGGPAASAALLSVPGTTGITLAGVSNEAGGKLEALPPDGLAEAVRGYDLTLIEGDGSRGLPLKAWAAHEPVVPPFTTVTVGIMPLWPLGRPASDSLVHRLPLFTALSGAAEGEILRPEHLVRTITGLSASREIRSFAAEKDGQETASGPGAAKLRTVNGGADRGRGLFAEARGKRILFFNQIDDGDLRQAEALAALLPREFLPELRWIIAGSVMKDRVTVLG